MTRVYISNALRGMSEESILSYLLVATQSSSVKIPQADSMSKNNLITGMVGYFISRGLILMVLMPKNFKKRLILS